MVRGGCTRAMLRSCSMAAGCLLLMQVLVAAAITKAPDTEAELRKEADRAGLPNLVVGVIENGKVAWVKSFGREAADEKTVYRIGSITKVFSGLALLQLRDAGKLSLDDRVDRWIPELQVVPPTRDAPPMTIRNIVTHTSGLPRVGALDYTSYTHAVTEAELLRAVRGVALETAPGARTSYSNLGGALVGIIIARASGESYRSYMQRHLFSPLGMTSTGWTPPATGLAVGHLKKSGAYVPAPGSWRFGAAEAAGGIYTTLQDLARFVSFELGAWPPRDAPDDGPVRRATVRESQLVAGFGRAGGGAFGVDWMVAEDARLGLVVEHTGSTGDYSASLALAPRRGLAVISLVGSGDAELLADLTRKTMARVNAADPQTEKASPAVETALGRVRGLIERANTAAIEQAFAPAFLRAIPAAQVESLFATFRREHPACAAPEVLESISPVAATARVDCAGSPVNLSLHTLPTPPYLLDGLTIKSAPRPSSGF
jgi:CubicO group peptidase (beta-lactamase class C family)